MITKIFLALAFLIAAAGGVAAQELEKVRIVYASRSMPFLSSFVAKEKGFYKSHGLDAELIQIAPRLAVTAVATGEVDYSMNIGSSLRAAMRGLPVRAVSSSTVAPFFALVAREKSVQDLKGKIVGVTDPGGTNYQVTKIILSQYGLTPVKDVPLITIGEEKLLLDAMIAGRIAAAAVSPPWPFEAERHGFHILVKASEVVQFPFVGVSTQVDKIKNKRGQVKRVIAAELDALKFIRERKAETVELIGKLFRMERDVAQKSYDFTASFFSKDARINPDGVKKLISIEQETGGLKADVSVAQVADLSLVDEALREQGGR